jgi:hypothetical protein
MLGTANRGWLAADNFVVAKTRFSYAVFFRPRADRAVHAVPHVRQIHIWLVARPRITFSGCTWAD